MTKKLGERLIEGGLVTREAVEQALQQQKITGHKLGDCLVDLGLISEPVLLRFLAAEMNTRFVAADKLAKVKIPPEVLDRVPVRMAEAQLFIPIAIDPERKILSIVAADPQNESLLDEVALVTGMDEVYAFIGLRSAINAGIKKHYYGDPTAFSSMEPNGAGPVLRADVSAMAAAYDARSDSRKIPIPLRFETDPRLRSRGTSAGSTGGMPQPTQLRDALSVVRGSVADNDFAETLNIMVGLLELGREHLRGHSAQLARQSSLVARRMGLSPREVSQLTVAAYLHHLGKPAERHFTLENNHASPEWAADAKRYLRAPLKLFENVRLPSQVVTLLGQLYEAYDGSGPNGLKGEEIAVGARILAAVDAYLDLMKNPQNRHRRTLSRDEALRALADGSGTLFDPVIVDLVGQIHSGELLRQRIAADGRQLVIADPDEAVRTDLMDALGKQGLVVQSVGTVEAVIDLALSGEADLVAVGLRFGAAELIALLDALRRQPATAAVPVVILGEPPESMVRAQLQQSGANAMVALPLEPDEAAQTIVQLYRDRIETGGPGHPVRGSYDEMPQGELMRVIAVGKKTGRLVLRSPAQEGVLHFEQGRLIHAVFGGASGEQALRAVAKLRNVEFVYEPEALLMDPPTLDVDPLVALQPLAAAG